MKRNAKAAYQPLPFLIVPHPLLRFLRRHPGKAYHPGLRGIISTQRHSAFCFRTVAAADLAFLQQAFKDAFDVVEKSTPFPIFVYAGNAQHEQSLDCQ